MSPHSPTVLDNCDPSTTTLEKLKEYYKSSEGYREHLRTKGPAYFGEFVNVVCACTSPSDLILDVGCGTGESSREIRNRNRNVVGTDLSRLFMNSPQHVFSVKPLFVTSDASKLPFANHTFDLVCAMEFIEHVWPVPEVLREIHRVLKPAGRLVLMSPNLLSPMWPIRDLPTMLFRREFRLPLYGSYLQAARFFYKSCRLSLKKMISQQPQFIAREPDLEHADGGGDYDSVYCSNARDIMLFLRGAGYQVHFANSPHTSFHRWLRNGLRSCFGSLWTSFLLKARKPAASCD